jgi:hypothetical protein
MFCRNSRHGRAVPVVMAALAAISLAAPLFGQAPAKSSTPPASPSAVAKPQAELPSARAVIDRHIKAIGGRDAVMSHTSQHATGTFSVPAQGLVGTIEIFGAANPNRAALKVNVPGLGDIASGFDGSHGWSLSPLLGPMLQVGKELDQAKFDADFYGDLRDAGRYRSMKTVEKTTFDKRDCYKVSLVREDGSEDFDFYDVSTGLRAGSTNTRETPMGSVKTTSIEADYRKFGNVLFATTVVQEIMGVEQKITLATVEFDKVPPTAFDLPEQIKALIK